MYRPWTRNTSTPSLHHSIYSSDSIPHKSVDFSDLYSDIPHKSVEFSDVFSDIPPSPPSSRTPSLRSMSSSESSFDHDSAFLDFNQFFRTFGVDSDEALYLTDLDLDVLMANLELVLYDQAQPGRRSKSMVMAAKRDLLAELGRLERVFMRMNKAGMDVSELSQTLKQAREFVSQIKMQPGDTADPPPPPPPKPKPKSTFPDYHKPLPPLPSCLKGSRHRKTYSTPDPIIPKPVTPHKVRRKPVTLRFPSDYLDNSR